MPVLTVNQKVSSSQKKGKSLFRRYLVSLYNKAMTLKTYLNSQSCSQRSKAREVENRDRELELEDGGDEKGMDEELRGYPEAKGEDGTQGLKGMAELDCQKPKGL